jgi:hypothetical protein
MDIARTIFLATHVLLGAATLLLAPGALLARKGGPGHRRWGQAYVAAMLAVCGTAAAISLERGSYAMLTVTLLALYLVVSARFVIRPPRRRGLLRAVPGAALVAAIVVCTYAAVRAAAGDADAAANLPLGVAAGIYGAIDLVRVRRGALPFARRRRVHSTRMILSYVTTVTAFAITNLRALPPVVTTFGPLAIGLAGIAYLGWREREALADPIRAAPRPRAGSPS